MTEINSSTDAAKALGPVAGKFALMVFATGIIGIGLLAVPILAGSAAFAVGEACRWPVGLERQPKEAMAFYTTLASAAMLGMAIIFMSIDPIRALYWSAVTNGICAVPVMVVMDANDGALRSHGRVSLAGLAAGLSFGSLPARWSCLWLASRSNG
ncbi:divalent metal cation transporter [Mesorhizobium sp.]|uniref:divalent metal cation transporter n=1 Tax=Mesorhizobium sp. TaxID=1871066 RepID=UPI0025C1F339|nr:divalent metal cation transporter [Mesorhizobium sp.]